jgi:hypothetical protein
MCIYLAICSVLSLPGFWIDVLGVAEAARQLDWALDQHLPKVLDSLDKGYAEFAQIRNAINAFRADVALLPNSARAESTVFASTIVSLLAENAAILRDLEAALEKKDVPGVLTQLVKLRDAARGVNDSRMPHIGKFYPGSLRVSWANSVSPEFKSGETGLAVDHVLISGYYFMKKDGTKRYRLQTLGRNGKPKRTVTEHLVISTNAAAYIDLSDRGLRPLPDEEKLVLSFTSGLESMEPYTIPWQWDKRPNEKVDRAYLWIRTLNDDKDGGTVEVELWDVTDKRKVTGISLPDEAWSREYVFERSFNARELGGERVFLPGHVCEAKMHLKEGREVNVSWTFDVGVVFETDTDKLISFRQSRNGLNTTGRGFPRIDTLTMSHQRNFFNRAAIGPGEFRQNIRGWAALVALDPLPFDDATMYAVPVPKGSKLIVDFKFDARHENMIRVYDARYALVSDSSNFPRSPTVDRYKSPVASGNTYYHIAAFNKPSPPNGEVPWRYALGMRATRFPDGATRIGWDDWEGSRDRFAAAIATVWIVPDDGN